MPRTSSRVAATSSGAGGGSRTYDPVFIPWGMVGGTIQIGGASFGEHLATALGVEPPKKVIEGIDKGAVKAKIQEHKELRKQALEAKDSAELRKQRRAIHRLKRRLRRAASLTT